MKEAIEVQIVEDEELAWKLGLEAQSIPQQRDLNLGEAHDDSLRHVTEVVMDDVFNSEIMQDVEEKEQ